MAGDRGGGRQELKINAVTPPPSLPRSFAPPPPLPERETERESERGVQRVIVCCYGNRGKPQASEDNVERHGGEW